jgi:DNA-binding transcriptional ArsR family regulator
MQERLELLLHPLRMRILTELIAHERTPSQVAAALPDVPHATLYRQIKLPRKSRSMVPWNAPTG